MNWDAVGAIAEGLGAIAVLATLIYLSTQIREQRRAAQRAIASDRWGHLVQLWLHRASNERFGEVYMRANEALGTERSEFVRALSERTGLDTTEARLLSWEQAAWWAYRSNLLENLEDLPPSSRASFAQSLRNVLRPSSVERLWWEATAQQQPDQRMTKFVEDVLAGRE
jgi:hypothetical protein